MIKYIVIKNNGEKRSDDIPYRNIEIQSSFDFCEPNIKRLVSSFINSKATDMLVVPFNDELVVLKKCIKNTD